MLKFLRKTWEYCNYNLNSGSKDALNILKFFMLVKLQSFLDQVFSLGESLSVIFMVRIFYFHREGTEEEVYI